MVSPIWEQEELLEIEYPKLALGDRKCEHGVILKIATNICGSDQHMVRGRTTAEKD
jgi:glutathione-independent formaldehyde dehydrogenase